MSASPFVAAKPTDNPHMKATFMLMGRLFFAALFLAPVCASADTTIQYGGLNGVTISSATSSLGFGSGISVNVQTGAVSIPDGMKMDDAARQFWSAVQTIGALHAGCAGDRP